METDSFPIFSVVTGLVGLIVLLFAMTRFLVNIGPREIAIKERRYAGEKMPPGRVVATSSEVGIQAAVLKPGLHLIFWPFERIVKKVPLIEIGPDELGVIEAVDGEPLPTGRIFAPDRAQNAHNNFQDPIAFIEQGGVKGIQMRILPPGLWPIHPYLFRVSIAKNTVIPKGCIGVVTAADGSPLDPGRLLGKAIEGHSNFQDAEQFIYGGGQKGSQVDILTPGTYRILTNSFSLDKGGAKPGLYSVEIFQAVVINENQVGLVDALDGSPLNPHDYVAAPVEGHNNHLLKYHVDVVNVLICHIRLPEELMKTQTEKILAEQRQNMYNAQREAESRRIELEKTKAHADNQRDLMAATVGVEILSKRSEQRKAEAEGEAYYILQTGKAEAEKVRLMGESQGVAYREQANALGPQGVALVETLKVIGEKGVRITPDVLASGGKGDAGNLGTLLLLNLFRNQLNTGNNSDGKVSAAKQ